MAAGNQPELFRNNADLNMNRYQMPGYTGYFPGKNTYLGVSRGRATQAALERGGYFSHGGAHSLIEPNQRDPRLVHLANVEAVDRKEHFDLKDHLQGGQPVYRDQMIPGYTGHNPCIVDKVGRRFAQRCLDGTLEFERIRAGIPRYRLRLHDPNATGMQLIGGRDHQYTEVINRDLVPIDATTPEFTPRFLGHNHEQIIAQYGLGLLEKTFSQFDKAKQVQKEIRVRPSAHSDYGGLPFSAPTAISYMEGALTPNSHHTILQYEPVILPPVKHPHLVPQLVQIEQPKTMDIMVPAPRWHPTLQYKLDHFKSQHAMSGFAGFVPEARDVLGESVNKAVTETSSHKYSPR
ncbi:uncharacterized protein LOC129590773 [Paramacrobiotus metropolitanus]|uniref:uncharacterized protein LOC129590773 n=1 Tax=Paramacrobiotus metropolitanus TaxID=2943436 RepID=UPI002445F8CB|nr:uncharacterized protein LOC129590773 [Paramacrobiotus metropolitanus]